MVPSDSTRERLSGQRGNHGSRPAVLLPTGDKMKTYGCMRSLHQRGIHVIVASEYDHVPLFDSRFCSEVVRLSSSPTDLRAYTDELLEVARRPDVETVIPVRERDVFMLAKYRDEFAAELSLVSPSLPVLRAAHDRLTLAREAERAGVPVAETVRLSDAGKLDGRAVIKSRYNILTEEYVDSVPAGTATEVKTVRFVGPGDDIDTDAIRADMRHEPIVQEFIPQADKHLYCALWDHGEPVATYQHRQLRQNSWMGGGGVYRESVTSEAVDSVATDLLERLDWHGLVCIEYIKDAETGEWKFLEINPRVWQSMPEAVRAGVDFPYYYWQCVQADGDNIRSRYQTGQRCHNAYGEVAHLMSVLRDESPFSEPPSFLQTLWDITSSCLTNPRFEYIRADDPKLFASALRQTVASGVTSSRDYGDDEPAGQTVRPADESHS